MIIIDGLRKEYKDGTVANKDISLTIDTSDIVGLIGANGAGKTTLVRQIVGLAKPTCGTITIDCLAANARREDIAHLVSFFNQKTILLEALTAFEVVAFTGVYRGMKKRDAYQKANDLLEYFGMEGCLKNRLSHMSGGQVKLVMIAAAFIGAMPIIVLDEPTNDLDPINRHKLWKLVRQYNQDYKTTFIVVSHNLAELETIARTIVVMKNGTVVEQGLLLELKEKYSGGYRVIIKCDYGQVETISSAIPYKYTICNDSEIVIQVAENDLPSIIAECMQIVAMYGAEMHISHESLSEVYEIIQGGSSDV
jgi:ABC-2 type transport system ATP-binding protein